jgi:HAD superfamily hydrolase (TIGR01450 family)
VDKFRELGFPDIKRTQVYTSASATASYLQRSGFTQTVFTTGSDGLCQELEDVGIRSIGGEAFAQDIASLHFSSNGNDYLKSVALDKSVGAVITGHNVFVSYASLSVAARYLLEQDTLFIATNGDKLAKSEGPDGNTVNLPAGGMSMAALEYATSRTPLLIGKPEQSLLDTIFEQHPDLSRERACMVGDRLDTDIEFGMRGGLNTLFVLSGTTSLAMLEGDESGIVPTHVAPSVELLVKGMACN